uniref:Uncharacterized protein n=1 Tax=Tetranychus urticae TaxID=32264 RepID=T1KJW3_TETUR
MNLVQGTLLVKLSEKTSLTQLQ